MADQVFAYNGLGARVSAANSGGTRTFKRDGAYVTDPVLSDTNPSFDPDTVRYTPGISERRDPTSRYLHSGIKNADSRTTTGTSIEATRSYDAFGNVVSSTGVWQGCFGYAGGFGYQEEPDTGLKLLGHRYYDSATGRFLSRDPIADGRNFMVYVDSEPIGNTDSTGFTRDPNVGPKGTRYRTDLSQKPYPNMHIYHRGGETVISHKGGYMKPSRGHRNAVPLPKDLRKPYRPIVRKFIRDASKVTAGADLGKLGAKLIPIVRKAGPIVAAVLFIADSASAGPVEAAKNATFHHEVNAAVDWTTKQGMKFHHSNKRNQRARMGARAGLALGEDILDEEE